GPAQPSEARRHQAATTVRVPLGCRIRRGHVAPPREPLATEYPSPRHFSRADRELPCRRVRARSGPPGADDEYERRPTKCRMAVRAFVVGETGAYRCRRANSNGE